MSVVTHSTSIATSSALSLRATFVFMTQTYQEGEAERRKIFRSNLCRFALLSLLIDYWCQMSATGRPSNRKICRGKFAADIDAHLGLKWKARATRYSINVDATSCRNQLEKVHSPLLFAWAIVRTGFPLESHSHPQNHRRFLSVICARTRCCSIYYPAWQL